MIAQVLASLPQRDTEGLAVRHGEVEPQTAVEIVVGAHGQHMDPRRGRRRDTVSLDRDLGRCRSDQVPGIVGHGLDDVLAWLQPQFLAHGGELTLPRLCHALAKARQTRRSMSRVGSPATAVNGMSQARSGASQSDSNQRSSAVFTLYGPASSCV